MLKKLKKFGIADFKSITTFFAPHFKLSKNNIPNSNDERYYMNNVSYTRIIGSFMYAIICTISNLAYFINILNRYKIDPWKGNWEALKWVLKYVKRSHMFGLTYGACSIDNSHIVLGYNNFDYAKYLDTRRSILRNVFTCYGVLVS